jgi:hypothetical protein
LLDGLAGREINLLGGLHQLAQRRLGHGVEGRMLAPLLQLLLHQVRGGSVGHGAATGMKKGPA